MNQHDVLFDRLKTFDPMVTSMVQHSYSPQYHDLIQFYVYVGDEMKYIVSTRRNDSFKRTELENKSMLNVLDGVSDKIKKSILFSLDVVQTKYFLYRVQTYYKRSSEYGKNINSLNGSFIEKILEVSNSWIYEFQKPWKKVDNKVSFLDKFESEVNEWRSIYKTDGKTIDFLNKLSTLNKRVDINAHISYSHGDFCYANYFLDVNKKFHVFDWEYIKKDDWVFVDPLSNTLVFWMQLFRESKVGSLGRLLVSRENELEKTLGLEFEKTLQIYNLDKSTLSFLILYVYCRLFLRKERSLKTLPLFEEMQKILILELDK